MQHCKLYKDQDRKLLHQGRYHKVRARTSGQNARIDLFADAFNADLVCCNPAEVVRPAYAAALCTRKVSMLFTMNVAEATQRESDLDGCRTHEGTRSPRAWFSLSAWVHDLSLYLLFFSCLLSACTFQDCACRGEEGRGAKGFEAGDGGQSEDGKGI